MLLAWFLAGSGLCLCLASVPSPVASHLHDCSTEPQRPAGDDDLACQSGCDAEQAVRTRVEARTLGEAATAVPGTLVEDSAQPSSDLPCMSVSIRPLAWPAPPTPPYILQSVLLL